MSKLKSKSQILNLKQNLESTKYIPSEIEKKWQRVWAEKKVYSPNLDTAKKPFYNLMMFPYPSAEGMHVGNMYAFTGADVYSRFKRMQGFDVFEPIGLDGFGIHSENYAIKIGRHPKEQAKISEANFYRQLRATGNGFDWSRKLETYDPKYYKWTQWLFIQLFKAGLAYRKKAPVNFCPSCKTVLANEQVVQKVRDARGPVKSFPPANARSSLSAKGGSNELRVGGSPSTFATPRSQNLLEEKIDVCERCEMPVEKKDLEQWFFRITHYAEKLLGNIEKLSWSQKVKIAQRAWIGRSEGALITFKIKNSHRNIDVFTTRPDTLFGATFLVISPKHPLVSDLFGQGKDVMNYLSKAVVKSEQERIAQGREKEGVPTWYLAINPVNNQEIPIWIADYVLMGYGTGAIMGVPAHDQRDFEFAKKYNLPIRQVILRPKVINWLEEKGVGRKEVIYHLRDWLISRQRYWGPPIPMIYCEVCAREGRSWFNQSSHSGKRSASRIANGNKRFWTSQNDAWNAVGWFPVPEKDLPVLLPDVKDWKPTGTGRSPLANVKSFVNTKCPNCKGSAKRETDVSDTFLDSAWYFFRYTSNDIESTAFDIKRVKKWLPVNMYIGGAEHSVLHLLYSRFVTMALQDLGFINFEEPFSRFYAHGLLLKEGAKMSKSKGNVVVPDQYVRKYGADTLRMYLMFLGPFNQGGDFYDTGIEGMHRFVKRVWRLFTQTQNSIPDSIGDKTQNLGINRLRMMHRTIKRVTDDISSLKYNTAIAGLMEWYNFLSSKFKVQSSKLSYEEIETFLKLIAPFAPHMTEQLFQLLRSQKSKVKSQKLESIHLQTWPRYDPKLLEENEVTIVVQVNGKVRDTIKVQSSKLKVQSYIEQLARKSDKVKRHLKGKSVRKVVYVEGKVINFVTE